MTHNTLLHEEKKALNEISATSAAKNNTDISSPKGGSDGLEQSYSLVVRKGKVYSSLSLAQSSEICTLPTALICFKNASGERILIRCLIDSGSQVCAITSECSHMLGMKKEKINIPVSGLNGTNIALKRKMELEISNLENDFVRCAPFYVVPSITNLTPSTRLNVDISKLPEGINLADPNFWKHNKIDALIGADLLSEMLKPNKFHLMNSSIILQETIFGYIVGSKYEISSSNEQFCGLLLESEDINKTMQNFWNIESVEESSHILNSEEELCEKHFLENYSRTPEGRYIVKIPLKNDKQLGESRTSAYRRLDALWRRLSKDTNLKTLYSDFMREYKDLGHMTEVKEAHEPELSVYLPHHGVYNPLKSSTKLRVVLNGSAPTSNGVSLNQIQLNGGAVQQDLFSIMIRFRKHEFVFTADVRMMYRKILIHPDQRDLQRIV
ncbi:hypothetical protein AVEN_252563-1 [Araneus ventricosus]|uniref:Uncharacterized protein n=1 Tax=Araneus ventricosus TaxID=182803 RepID=A0A4Y2ARC3_ARAVE|nr:hypothetical protein AVEN_252563-1 [Araneus ventricosus]